ncbi:MAG: hypothetical protein N2653_07560 [Burkholderiales bacterium]|nr:hypothetical protein [Burkholderiales bacterium]
MSDETLRWPTNLDRAAIVERLLRVRETAAKAGLTELVERLADVETMSGPKIGSAVVAALTWLQDRPAEREIVAQLEIVAVNLKNLK